MSERSKQTIETAVYYYPQWHPSEKNNRWFDEGWTEWELVKNAPPFYPGHNQPRQPLWGFLDESRPETAERQIEAAAKHGVDTFVFDWYWYEGEPFLHEALEEGFLKAENSRELNFSIMWANHSWHDWFPCRSIQEAYEQPLLMPVDYSRRDWFALIDYLIENYFHQPNYWRIDGALHFSIYQLDDLYAHFGEETTDLVAETRQRVRDAGLGEIHLQVAQHFGTDCELLPVLQEAGFDSAAHYITPEFFVNKGDRHNRTPYKEAAGAAVGAWPGYRERSPLPYYPAVTAGWDTTPRIILEEAHKSGEEPVPWHTFDESGEAFYSFLKAAGDFLLAREDLDPKILFITAWNEWSEGHYLEPDKIHGYDYLEALKKFKEEIA